MGVKYIKVFILYKITIITVKCFHIVLVVDTKSSQKENLS